MKPGRRHLLIPGLLIGLLIVVVLAALVRRAEADATPLPPVPHTQVSVMADSRITESSGLAASLKHPGIAYTVNDSGDEPRIFAVDVTSGRVVGVTSVDNAKWRDAEAMALWGGKVWVADVGNNLLGRTDRALYAFDEPGPGDHRVDATRYPVTFTGRPFDVEAMVIVPGRVEFFWKGWPEARSFAVAMPLKADKPNVARATGRKSLAFASDATATADGRYILVRGPVSVQVHDAASGALVHTDVVPTLAQGETITMEASGRSYLIGSEGSRSPLVRIAFDPTTFSASSPPPPIDLAVQLGDEYTWTDKLQAWVWAHRSAVAVGFVLGAAASVAGVLAGLRRRRRRRSAHADD